jgi:hypothetical protein
MRYFDATGTLLVPGDFVTVTSGPSRRPAVYYNYNMDTNVVLVMYSGNDYYTIVNPKNHRIEAREPQNTVT